MVDLDFKWLPGNTYPSGKYTISVTRETFKEFPMFHKVKFQDIDGLRFVDFTLLSNGRKYSYYRNLERWSNVVDILYVEVFVYEDNEKDPILVGLNNGGKYFYYKISETQKNNNCFELKTPLHYSFLNLFETLIDENEEINKKITFVIDKKSISKRIIANLGTEGNFTFYKHEPKQQYKSWSFIVLKGTTRVTESKIFEALGTKHFDSMIVYYRSGVKHSEIPLLIEFRNEKKRYYLCKENIHEKNWTPIEINDVNLSHKLEEIETQLFYSVSVSIHETRTYTRGVIKQDTHSKGLNDTNKEDIVVKKFNKCLISNYVCYEHDLSIFVEEGFKKVTHGLQDNLKSLFVNIFNTLIKIIDGELESFIFFVEEDPKFYVWFYKNKHNPFSDNLPLMIQYYKKIYVPKSKEAYLDKWETLTHSFDLENCKKNEVGIIEQELDRVNFMLNSVDLNHKIVDTSVATEYGIPRPADLNPSFNTTRIHVEPKSYDKLFVKCKHSTKNGFMIKEAYYAKPMYCERYTNQKSRGVCKFSPNKEQKIDLNVKTNEVTVYYFMYDPDSEYPLIVEYKLSDQKYVYYTLQCDFSKGPRPELVHLTNGNEFKENHIHSILRHQNFVFHHVINIKLNRKTNYTCCDKGNDKHLTFMTNKLLGVENCLFEGENVKSITNFPFIKVDDFNTKLQYGYTAYEHSLKTFFTDDKKEPLDDKFDNIKIKGFQIDNSEIKLNDSGLEGRTFVKAPYVFVYFYRDDPRPLLLCYNYKAYVPKDKSTYHKNWHPVEGVANFILKTQSEFNLLDSKVLDTLNDTVGFLNTVNLYEHRDHSIHTYVVHAYNGKEITVKVTNKPLLNDQQTPICNCYKRLTHTPNGTNGTNGDKFRLGNIEYNNSKLTCKLNYFEEDHKWCPLTSVSVYYYNYDTGYKDPLLVELVFENTLDPRKGTLTDFYKLTRNHGPVMNWEKDGHGNFDTKVGGQALIDHLDEIRYGLKKVLKIELGERATYNLMLSRDVGNADQFRIEKGYKVEVEQCTGCSNQFNGRFKTFHHKISKINGKFDYNSIGGLKFILPGMNKKPIKILLDDPKGSKTIGNLSYNLCMGDVYVYFSNDSDPSAQVPLFFYFNDKWYMPGTIQDYFAKWSYIEQSEVLNKMNRLVDDRIKDYVNKVNRMTNNLDEFQDFSVEFTRPVSSEVNEMPSVNSIKMPPVDDLEIFTVRKEKPSENFANSYVDIETTPFYNLKISSDNDIRKPCLDFEMPYIDPKIPSDNNMKIPSDDDKETPCVDLEMPSDIYVEKPYVDFQMPFIGLKKPHLADLEKFSVDGFEKPSIIHEDQPKEVPIYDILDFSQSHGPDVELGKGLRNFSDTGKHSEEELTGFPEPVIMAYTGLASASDESNQSHLGSILGGTFGSLITIGLFTFMLFTYFRRVKIRNMIPNLY